MKRVIQTDAAPAAIGPYSQAIWDEATGYLYCSGQIGLEPKSGGMASGGVEPEFRQVLSNVRGLLAAAGLDLSDVIKTTLYLADMEDFARVNALYGEAFAAPYPARSTVAAAALPKGARVELEIIAASRKSSSPGAEQGGVRK